MLPSGANLTLGTRLLFCHASESGDPEQAKPYQRRLDPRFRGGDEEEKPGAICLVHTTRLLGVMLPAMVSAALVLAPVPSSAQTVKIGHDQQLFRALSRSPRDQMQKGIDLYVKEHEKDLPPGVKIEIIKRDDTSNPEVGKRLAQELITRDHVQLLTGVILSPVAAAVAPLTAEAKVPLVITNAAAGVSIPRISPYVVRVSFTLWQECLSDRQMGRRAGLEDRLYRGQRLHPRPRFRGGLHQGLHRCRRQDRRLGPLSAAQSRFRAVRAAHQGRQARRRLHLGAGRHAGDGDDEGDAAISACAKPASTIVAPQDLLPDEELPNMGDTPLGLITSGTYSAAGNRPANKAFLAAWNTEYGDKAIPDFFSVDGWDGMAAIFDLIKATKGKFTGDEAMAFLSELEEPG